MIPLSNVTIQRLLHVSPPIPSASATCHPCGTNRPINTPTQTGAIGRPSTYLRVLPVGDAVLVYHSLLGNRRFADSDILDFLSLTTEGLSLEQLRSRFPAVDLDEEVKAMRGLGFLVDGNEEKELRARLHHREASYSRGELVRWLRLNTATGCNLACTYCHGTNEAAPGGPTRMSLDVACKAIRLYVDVLLEHKRKLMQLRYFGGEPLLNWPVVRDSLAYAANLAAQHGLALTVYLNTNATLLTPSMVHDLAAYRNCLYALVSLDGPARAHDAARKFPDGRGSFDLVCRGLDLLQEAEIPVDINATLGAHNEWWLRQLIDLLLERRIHAVCIDPVRIVPEKSDPDFLAKVLFDAVEYASTCNFWIHGSWEGVCERLEHGAIGAFCGGSGCELSVLPTGEVYPCQSQPIRLGTLDDVETRALFSSESYRQVAMRVVGNLPECRGCEIEGMCAGGCAADAYACGHNLYGRTRYCEFLRAMVRHHLMRLGQAVSSEVIM